MEYENENFINIADINYNNINNIKISNREIKYRICPSSNKLEQTSQEYINQLSSNQKHKRKTINEKFENNGNIGNYDNCQEITSKRITNKSNISNLESTFSQTFRTFRYEPLTYCPSQDSILNNLSQTTRNQQSLNLLENSKNDNNRNTTYYNYNEGKEFYDEIFKTEKKEKTSEDIYESLSIYNYIEQMRKIYEMNQNNLRLKQYYLQKKLFRANEENEMKINNLKIEIDNIKSRNENDIKILISENKYNQRKELDKREKEINMISKSNFELEMANNDLIEKIDEVVNLKNQDKIKNREKIAYFQFEINNLIKNNYDLKKYYEKKIEYLIRLYNEEKNKLIGEYEFHIDKINLGFVKSKNDYINQSQQKDNKLRKILQNFNNEANILNNEIKDLNEELLKLKDNEKHLIQNNIELKKENEILKQNYEAIKRDMQYQVKKKQIIERSIGNTQRQIYKLKAENEKLNRLTYGNFKRNKSMGF